MRTRRIVLRLAPRPIKRRYLLALLLVLAVPLFSQDKLSFTAYFPTPLARFTAFMTTGTAGSPTLLARWGGAVGIFGGVTDVSTLGAPANLLVVAGQTVVGGNKAPPGSEPLSTTGPGSGLSMDNRVGGARWVTYPTGGSFNFWNTATGSTLTVDPSGKLPMCQIIPFTCGGTLCPGGSPTTFCPGAFPWVYDATDAAAYPIAFWDNVNSAGFMVCCSAHP